MKEQIKEARSMRYVVRLRNLLRLGTVLVLATLAHAQVSVAINPTSTTVTGGGTRQFQAIVSGTTNKGVKWYVNNVLGGNADLGYIYTNGTYSAPNVPGSRTVKVVSNAEPTKSASSAVTIIGDIYVVVTPQVNCLGHGNSLQFTAKVYGTTNQGVIWQVNSVTGGNSSVGTISSMGLYTAPNSSGTFSVRAVSKANTSKVMSVSVSVQSGVTVAISPSSYTVLASQQQPIKVKLCGRNGDAPKWSVDGVAGGNGTVGTIDTNGVYTAPAIAGTHTIRATSTADGSKSSSATVNVIGAITVDFGNRDNTGALLRPGVINAQISNLSIPATQLQMMKDAGFTGVRMHSFIADIYATRTPDWTKLDPTISRLKSAGLPPVLEITYTPTWLVPTVSGCTKSYKMPPNDLTTYAQLAASIVAHMEQNFPGFVKEYEIWNEPDLASFCVSPNDNTTRKAKYLNLYAAVAPAMKAEAAKYGAQILIGGPTVVSAFSDWVPALTTNSKTAPYVDFVSYHHYPTGEQDARNGMTWDFTSAGGPRPLFERIQDTSTGPGVAARFKNVAGNVAKGIQPNATSTPTYLDEYNDNWWFGPTCCRNTTKYSPVFNALWIADMLNSVYQGAPNTPGKLHYYSSNSFPYFCLFGGVDANMDCATFAWSAYPQFYALKLIAGGSYLGIKDGGRMPKSISPLTTAQLGLSATAFYTASRDSILIINPSAVAYSNVQVFAKNTGFITAKANMYLLNETNKQISSQPLALNLVSGGYTANIDVPPYSVVGISITP
jgi:hypothetical protein